MIEPDTTRNKHSTCLVNAVTGKVGDGTPRLKNRRDFARYSKTMAGQRNHWMGRCRLSRALLGSRVRAVSC